MEQELGPLARELAAPYYEDALPAHDRFHANRVRNLGLRLADEVPDTVDREVLAAAAWLHDIGRPRERTGAVEDHNEWATAESRDLLTDAGVAAGRIDAISHCIGAHSIRPGSPDPETVEARLLFDADKLDAAGARGIVRLSCLVGERSGRAGEQYAVIDDASGADIEAPDGPDIRGLREWARARLDALYTDPGRELGAVRWEFMDEFFERFCRERGVDADC